MIRPAAVGLTIEAATAAYASDPQLAHVQPIVRQFAGYEFEVGPMIAGLCACLAVRFYVSKTEPEHKWTVDMPVTFLALAFTAAFIQRFQLIPIYALLWGTGLGALGVGIIRFALSFVRKNLGQFGGDEGEEERPKP